MAAPSTTLDKIRYRLIDISATNPNLVSTTTLQASVDMALAKFVQDKPRVTVADVTGNGTPFMVLVGTGAVLASWVDGFSRVDRAEYPAEAVSTGYVPSYLEEGGDFEVGYRDASKTYLRFITATPSATETVRFTYTTPYTHTTVTDNVSTGDIEALCDLAAHFACMQLATKAAGANDPLVQADAVNYRDSQLRYSQQATAWLNAYNSKMGISTGGGGEGKGGSSVPGASATGDWDSTLQSGYPQITHWGRRR